MDPSPSNPNPYVERPQIGCTRTSVPPKTVWHRELRLSSPTSISRLSEVRESRFPNRLPFCRFAVEGEAGTFELQVENESVAQALRSLKTGVFVCAAQAQARNAKASRARQFSTGDLTLIAVVLLVVLIALAV